MQLYKDGNRFIEHRYATESEYEKDVFRSYKAFFGPDALLIEAKRRIDAKALGGSIPDGFLFDLADPNDPRFYLVEIELARHSFNDHIFPQVTKFFGFFRNPQSRARLVEKLYGLIQDSSELKSALRSRVSDGEIYKFLRDVVDDSQNILLVLDAEKRELPEIIETYAEWGRMVKAICIQRFDFNEMAIFTVHPDFSQVEYGGAASAEEAETEGERTYDEEFHLEGKPPNVKAAYEALRGAILTATPEAVFRPTKAYISVRGRKNVSYIQVRGNRIKVVVLEPEGDVAEQLSHHEVLPLAQRSQQFWGGPSCTILVDDEANIGEVAELIGRLVRQAPKNHS